MKCKHMHKDAPENKYCEDCFEDRLPKNLFKMMKGGKENEK